LSLPAASYPENAQALAFYTALEERLGALPGVRTVGSATSLPMSGFYQAGPILIDGREPPRPGEEEIVQIHSITPDFLPAMGVPVVRGRGLTAADGPESPRVALLTEAAAERFFPGQEAVGQRVALFSRTDPQWAEVVGVVGNVRSAELAEEAGPGIYFPHSQRPARQMSLVLHAGVDPMSLVPAVLREVQELDPNLPLFNTR